MEPVWRSTAWAIRSMCSVTCTASSTTLDTEEVTLFTAEPPLLTASMERWINSMVALAAWSDFDASSRTSPATTAKPLPASPALAASTEAFRARMLVWRAMSSMVSIMCLISLEVAVISSMARFRSSMFRLLCNSCVWAPFTAALVCSDSCAVFFASLSISDRVAESSTTALACSVEPWDRAVLEAATWAELSDTWLVVRAMPPRVWFNFSFMVSRSCLRARKSPG